jgi:hypothetical protein
MNNNTVITFEYNNGIGSIVVDRLPMNMKSLNFYIRDYIGDGRATVNGHYFHGVDVTLDNNAIVDHIKDLAVHSNSISECDIVCNSDVALNIFYMLKKDFGSKYNE